MEKTGKLPYWPTYCRLQDNPDYKDKKLKT